MQNQFEEGSALSLKSRVSLLISFGSAFIFCLLFSLFLNPFYGVAGPYRIILPSLLVGVAIYVFLKTTESISWKRRVALLFGFAVLCIFLFHQVLFQSGWPANHETLTWKNRTLVYIAHYNRSDFWPVWASSDALGMGTPLPIYYHKVVYIFTSSFTQLFGSMKIGLLSMLILFLGIYCMGMYRLFSISGIARLHSIILVCVSMLFNYIYIDWFIRGAFAEYTFLCLVPWLLLWTAVFLKKGKLKWWLVPLMILLYMSHNVLALYSCFFIGLALAIKYKSWTGKQILNSIFRLSVFGVIVLLTLFILHFPILSFLENIDPSRIIHDKAYHPVSHYFHFFDIVLNLKYEWGKGTEPLSFEMNNALTLGLLISFVGAIFLISKKKITFVKKWIRQLLKKQLDIYYFLAVVFVLFLLIPISKWFYLYVPGMKYIQFPWRMFVFFNPLMLILVFKTLKLIMRELRPRLSLKPYISISLLVISLIEYPGLRSADYKWFSKDQLENNRITKQEKRMLFGIGEYSLDVGVVFPDNVNVYQSFASMPLEFVNYKNNKVDAFKTNGDLEPASYKYHIDVLKADDLILPLSFTKYYHIHIDIGGIKIPLFPQRSDNENDPRLMISVPKGRGQLVIKTPDFAIFW